MCGLAEHKLQGQSMWTWTCSRGVNWYVIVNIECRCGGLEGSEIEYYWTKEIALMGEFVSKEIWISSWNYSHLE